MASIHRDGERSPWKVTWREEGRQRSRRFVDRNSAVKFHADLIKRRELGAHAAPEASRMTLREFMERWFDSDGAEWELSTRRQRAWIADRHIDGQVGGVRLRDLGVSRIKDWRMDLVRTGRSANTINAASRVLSACLTAAVGEGLIPANPILSPAIRPIPQAPAERRAIPLDDVETIRARMTTDRDRAIVSTLAYAGLRPGELVALRRSDIRESTIFVGRSYGAAGIKGTKTGSVRAVPVADALREDLQRVARDGQPDGFLFPGDRGGPLNWRNWNRRVWVPAVESIGADWVPYECRHTYASVLIRSGMDVVTVAHQLGHANPTTTLRVYAHLIADARLGDGRDVQAAVRAARDAVG